jgi:hypothetical protein
VKQRLPPFVSVWTMLFVLVLCATGVGAVQVSRIQVRIVTGAEELSAGSYVELRIYEAGNGVRRLALTHGEAWPRDSTRIIPLALNDGLDPRTVSRFGLYYHAASPQAPAWEIIAANVELPSGQEPPERLLDATLSGVIDKQGELATGERDHDAPVCISDAECDDKRTCNGNERCAPRAAGADARGCVKGTPLACPVNQICIEGRGCRGAESYSGSAKSAPPSAETQPPEP